MIAGAVVLAVTHVIPIWLAIVGGLLGLAFYLLLGHALTYHPALFMLVIGSGMKQLYMKLRRKAD